MRKDFIGNTVNVGDTIYYATTGRYVEARVARIVRITDRSIIGEILKSDGDSTVGTTVQVKARFVKVAYSG